MSFRNWFLIHSPDPTLSLFHGLTAPPIPFVAPPSPSAPSELANEEEKEEQEDPFGSHAEIDASDPRASMDTLALSAALSANLDAEN